MPPENFALFVFIVAMTIGVVAFGVIHWIRMSTIKKVQDNNLADVVGQVNSNFATIAEHEKKQEKELGGVKSKLGELGTGLTGADAQLKALDSALNRVTSELDALEGSTSLVGSSLEKQVGDLNAGMSRMNGEYADLKSRVSDWWASASTDLKTLATRLGFVKGQVDVVMDETSSLSNKVGGVSTTVATVNSRMSGLDSSVTALSGQVSSMGTAVTNMKSSVDSLVGENSKMNSKIGELGTAVGAATGGLSDVKTAVTNLETKVVGHDTSLSTMGSSLGGLNTEVSNLKTSWQTQFNTLNSKVDSHIAAATTATTPTNADVNTNNATVRNMLRVNRTTTDAWPTGYAAGVHAQNVYANNNIALGAGGATKTWFNSAGAGLIGTDLTVSGNQTVNGHAYFKGGTSVHNPGKWQTHFPWPGDQKNYIRGDTEMRGNTNQIGDITVGGHAFFKGGVSRHNPGKWQTHFPWPGDQKNYIRGDTEMRGDVNNMGDLSVGGNLSVNRVCAAGQCFDANRVRQVLQRARLN